MFKSAQFFTLLSLRTPQTHSTDPLGVHGPQVKNLWSRGMQKCCLQSFSPVSLDCTYNIVRLRAFSRIKPRGHKKKVTQISLVYETFVTLSVLSLKKHCPYKFLVKFLQNGFICCSSFFSRFLAQKRVERMREANRVRALETSSAILIQRRWRRHLVTC